ncbi:hypothetical protein P389DRAFT_169164 [Cystobasidium minutum MCA 4210]|uniref:uncharacterized protein n=1 Tax=Cystobasidium minutum MCA 4210 TaxID=1397322 RepID=UPI0034CD2E31|eukprot:jgi/Rhomi1/169164/fgenesh1_kg.3_\
MEVNDSAEDRARTSTFSAVSHPYNAASTLAPSQRDLRIQAARRNLAEHQEQHHQQQVGATIAADNDDTTTTGTSTTDEDNARPDNANARQRTKKPDLHRIVTETGHGRPSAHTGNTHAASKNASDAIFAQLQVIQTLQDEITREHAKLESLDNDALSPMLDGSGNKDEHAARTKATTSSTSPKSPTSNKAAGERASTTADKVRPDKTKHGPTKPAASGSNAKERTAAHAYDDLAAAFQERADGVEAIMEKMSKLSQAVKEFHSLPPPVLFPDSRMLNTGDVVETPIAMTPHIHHRTPR